MDPYTHHLVVGLLICNTTSKQAREQRSLSMFLVKEICDFAQCMPSLHFHHVKGEQNVVAYELAQLAKRLYPSAVWRDCMLSN